MKRVADVTATQAMKSPSRAQTNRQPAALTTAFWRRLAIRLREQSLAIVLLVLLVILTVLPIISVIVGSFRPLGLPLESGWTIAHYVDVWTSPFMVRIVGNTLLFAFGSAFLSLIIAGSLAWLIERTNVPGRDFFAAGIILPMATPPMLLAIGWVLLTSPQIGLISNALRSALGPALVPNIYSIGGMIFVQALTVVPTAFMILSPVMRNMDPSFEEAAAVSGAGTFQTLRRVSLPFLTPAGLSVMTFLVLVGMLTFDVPAIIGLAGNIPVMSSEIFLLMNPSGGLPDYGKSAAMNSSLFVTLGGALALYYYLTRQGDRFSTIKGKAYRPRRFDLGVWRGVAATYIGLYFLLAVVLPFLMILWVSLTPYFTGFDIRHFSQLSPSKLIQTITLPRVRQGAVNSLVVSTVSAAVLTALSLVIGWTIVRSNQAWTRILDFFSVLPIAIPNLMMGIALAFIFFSFRAIPIYGTIWIIALGHVIVYLPVAVRMMQAAVLQLHRELEEAGATSGATKAQAIRRIVVPLVIPSIISLYVWVMVHSFREFSLAVMLRTGNNEVLSTVLYSYWDNGQADFAAAIAVTMMLSLGVIVFIAYKLGAYGRASYD